MTCSVREIKIARNLGIDLYRNLDGAGDDFEQLMSIGSEMGEELGTRRIWMLSTSTSGSSAAEIIPSVARLASDAGADTRWLALEGADEKFFATSGALVEALYGEQIEEPALAERRALYDRVCEEVADSLQRFVDPHDILVVHGAPLAGVSKFLPEAYRARLVWRCHSGHPDENEQTEAAWEFLRPYVELYAKCIFSELRYIPRFLRQVGKVVTPGIDPLTHKNRLLRPYKLIGILRSAGLVERPAVPEWAAFDQKVKVLRGNTWHEEPVLSLLHKPQIVQISRFDKMKGFGELLDGFAHLLEVFPDRIPRLKVDDERVAAELEQVELVLAGPDPDHTPGDPNAAKVLRELAERHSALGPELAKRVHVLRLPATNRKENSLLVNALQRIAAVVAQCSLHQGFGLTVTEALWKGAPVVATNVGGIGLQIRDEVDGLLIDDPGDPEAVAMALLHMVANRRSADSMSRSGHRRVAENFVVLRQVRELLAELGDVLKQAEASGPRPVEGYSRAAGRTA